MYSEVKINKPEPRHRLTRTRRTYLSSAGVPADRDGDKTVVSRADDAGWRWCDLTLFLRGGMVETFVKRSILWLLLLVADETRRFR